MPVIENSKLQWGSHVRPGAARARLRALVTVGRLPGPTALLLPCRGHVGASILPTGTGSQGGPGECVNMRVLVRGMRRYFFGLFLIFPAATSSTGRRRRSGAQNDALMGKWARSSLGMPRRNAWHWHRDRGRAHKGRRRSTEAHLATKDRR